MTNEEALKRFEGDLAFLRRTCTHSTTQMELYECAIKALEDRPTGDMAIEALEFIKNHTPVEKWGCVEDDNYSGGGYWECPSCKNRFSFKGFNMLNHMPYCPRCGDRVKTELEAEE